MNGLTKTSIITAAGILICVASAVWGVMPALRQINALNEELSSTKAQAASLQQQILAYQTAESDLNKATDKNEILNAILPKENLVTVIKQTEEAIASSNTTEQRLSINDPFIAAATGQPVTQNPKASSTTIAGLSGVTPVQYELSVKNNYAGIINLFQYMEHLPNFTEISSFQLTAETASGSGGSTTDNKPAVHTGQINADINAIYFAKKDASTKN